MECVARYIFNSLSGSILTFYMSLLLLIFIRPLIRNYRTLYYLYLLPFLKVFYDLFFMDHSHWAFLHGKNVLNAKEPLYIKIEPSFLFSQDKQEWKSFESYFTGMLGVSVGSEALPSGEIFLDLNKR
ncbi:hypothetical protein [Candidatus Neptunichlamydia sp. REUL1]|uniref:hypothetical protein n=1 Tax=Candidatus Neptunichlamydia sp. REUL1 TaxID=3064277 RepID=UPI00292EE758|nr:hypothetical protein [Candidatus Neptunochlamydia sp. REUL1]